MSGAVVPGTVDVDATGNYTFTGSGAITSNGALTKRGSGTLTISNTGANSFAAATLDGGTLALTVYDALGGTPLALNAGTLNLSASTPSPLVVNAPVAINVSGANRESTGAWSGSGAAALSIGNNTFSLRGNTSAFAGTISLGTSTGYLRLYGSLGSPLATFDLGTSTADLLNRDGNAHHRTRRAARRQRDRPLRRERDRKSHDTTASARRATIRPSPEPSPTAPASRTITKTGSGVLTLTGTSTHTGATTVSNGALVVAGTINNSAATVASGALLAGGGNLNGGVTGSLGRVSFARHGALHRRDDECGKWVLARRRHDLLRPLGSARRRE